MRQNTVRWRGRVYLLEKIAYFVTDLSTFLTAGCTNQNRFTASPFTHSKISQRASLRILAAMQSVPEMLIYDEKERETKRSLKAKQ